MRDLRQTLVSDLLLFFENKNVKEQNFPSKFTWMNGYNFIWFVNFLSNIGNLPITFTEILCLHLIIYLITFDILGGRRQICID